ncbi:hypothetical protein RvY_07803 [Ramazzottius varieornatus]|uniref:CCHC FOG-type domain-containing protein n=1 Tax=Ramazzottius varieornatus TaxID=947166 RepID=A0A1D1V3H3_RAMVA|nr:hypothetical protein RvY_07803 [Ramazzottius varieornatus]
MAQEQSDIPLDLSTRKPSLSTSLSESSSEIVQLLTKEKAKPYPCVHCNIGFTSAKTLLVHTNYYCAKTAPAIERPVSINHKETNGYGMKRLRPESAPEIPAEADTRPKNVPEFSEDEEGQGPKTPEESGTNGTTDDEKKPSPKSSEGHFCPDCAFRANTVRGLRSHFKCHSRDVSGKVKVQRTRTPGGRSPSRVVSKRPKIDGVLPNPMANSGLPEKKKFCKYCDISFKYLSTFLAHRKYYCTVRKTEAGTTAGGATS